MPSVLTCLATERASDRDSPATKREDRRRASAEVSIQRRKRACRERKSKNSRTFQDTMQLRACRKGGNLRLGEDLSETPWDLCAVPLRFLRIRAARRRWLSGWCRRWFTRRRWRRYFAWWLQPWFCG